MKQLQKYLPFDKYWTLRMGILDVLNNKKDINRFLAKQPDKNLGEDIRVLKGVARVWATNKPVDVGECGTLYRYLQFASWQQGLNKKFIKHGTLVNRKICNDPNIVHWKLRKLLTLDGGTSQWASAAVLLGNKESIKNAPYFLKITYEAQKHWNQKRKQGKKWEPKYDELLSRQATYFLNRLHSKTAKFIPTNPDDYCFARAFGIVSRKDGEKRWPMIQHHETNRLKEMERVMALAEKNKPIDSKDHRVVQALAMWGILNKKKQRFTYLKSVNKSWPQFWKFLAHAQK